MASDWFVRFAGRGRSKGPNQVLDRQIAAALEYQRIARLPALESMEITAARRFAEENLGATELPPEPMAEIVDTAVATIGSRRASTSRTARARTGSSGTTAAAA